MSRRASVLALCALFSVTFTAFTGCAELATFLGVAAPLAKGAGEVLEAVNRSRLAAGLGPLPPQDPRYGELEARVKALEDAEAKEKVDDEARARAEAKAKLEDALEDAARTKETNAVLRRRLASAIRAAKAPSVPFYSPPPIPTDLRRPFVDAGADQ